MTREEAARWLAAHTNIGAAYDDEVEKAYLALTAPPAAAEPKTEGACYLIERGQSERHAPTVWWRGPGPHDYTEDPSLAVKFAERGEAQRTLDAQGSHFVACARVTEHVFLANPSVLTSEKDEGDDTQVVTAADAAKLEAVVEAAREMRAEYEPCDVRCDHEDCFALRAFDAAVAKLEGKP